MADLAYRDGRVVLADPKGNIGDVAPEELQHYLDQGFTPVAQHALTKAEQDAAERDRNESLGAKARTAVTSVSQGLAAPLTWALGPTKSDIPLFQAVNKQTAAEQEANPLTTMGGHMAGEMAGLKGFGIAGGAAKAGAAIANPIARAAVTAGVEGAGLGTIGAMEDPDASAEHVLASGALGALIGAGTGTVFSAAGRGLSKVFGRAGALEDTVANPENFSRAKDIYNSAVSVASKTPKEILEEVGPFGARRAEAEAASHGLEDTINKQALEMQPLITKVDENVDAITRRVRDKMMKEEGLAKIAGNDFDTPTRSAAAKGLVRGAYEDVAPQLQAIEEFESAHPEVRIPAQTRRELNALRSELEDAVKATEAPVVIDPPLPGIKSRVVSTNEFSRRTKGEDPMSQWGHAMFVDKEHGVTSNASYGANHWAIKPGVRLPYIADLETQIEAAAEKYGLPEGYESVSQLMDSLNPSNIVDSALGWDEAETVSWFWEHIGDRIGKNGIKGVETKEGAIIFDPSAISKFGSAVGEPHPGDAIKNLSRANGIKQKLDTVVKGLRTDTRRMAGSISSNQSRNMLEIANGLQAAADKTRETLMSEKLWGKAVASAQRDVNEIWSGGAISAMKRFGKNFMRDTGEEHYFRGGNIFENDPAQTAKSLRSLGTPEGWLSETAMSDYIEHAGKLIDTIGEKYGVEGGEKALIDETKAQLTELKARFGSVKDKADLAKKYERMLGIEEHNRGIANSLPLLGGVLGGPIGAGVGAAARSLMQPASIAHGLSEMARATERIHAVTDGVKTWLSKGAGAVSSTGRNRVLTSAALHVWSRKGKSDRETYQERATTVTNADLASVGPHVEGLPPDVQAAAGGGTARALQYLQALLPAKAGGPTLMNPTRAIQAAVPEQQKFAKAWATVVDPTSAIRDLKRGQLSPIQVQALKTVYPRIYDDVRLSALQGIAQADASGNAIPLHTRQQLSLLLDLGGAAQPAFSDQMVDIIQQGLAAQNKPAQGQKAPQLSKGLKSPSQSQLG